MDSSEWKKTMGEIKALLAKISDSLWEKRMGEIRANIALFSKAMGLPPPEFKSTVGIPQPEVSMTANTTLAMTEERSKVRITNMMQQGAVETSLPMLISPEKQETQETPIKQNHNKVGLNKEHVVDEVPKQPWVEGSDDELEDGERYEVIQEEWKKYLPSKVELQAFPKFSKKKPKVPKGFGLLHGVIPCVRVSRQKAEVSSVNKQENDALQVAALKTSKLLKLWKGNRDTGDGGTDGDWGTDGELEQRSKRKKKKTVIAKFDPGPGTNIRFSAPISTHGGIQAEQSLSYSCYVFEKESESDNLGRGILRKHDQGAEDLIQLSLVEIEVYKTENPSRRSRIYFLFYENSTEAHKFEASIRRDNGACESLIGKKSLMMLPVNQDDHFLGMNSSLEPQSVTAQNMITCEKTEVEKEMQTIVDTREFMSSLPKVHHMKGMHIIPAVLEIFVGGLDPDVTDDKLRESFIPFGEIVSVKIPVGRGCGFVQFAQRSNAEDAIQRLNGDVIGKQKVRLSWGRAQNNKQSRGDHNQWNGGHYTRQDYNGYGGAGYWEASPYGGRSREQLVN